MITILKKPQKFQPSETPNIFQVESDNSNILYFIVEVREAVSNTLISKSNIYTTMDTPQGSFMDLSGTLQNYVKWEVSNSVGNLYASITKSILSYKVTFTEMGIVSGTYTNLGSPYTLSDVFTVWNSKMDKFNFGAYNMNQYVINNTSLVKFLTHKPDNVEVNQFSFEQLYFLYDDTVDLQMNVKIYNSAGELQMSNDAFFSGGSKMYRLQVSPKALNAAGLTYTFIDGDYYTVQVSTTSGTPKTELRTYKYKDLPCHLEPVNICFTNSLGGIDSYQFINPQDALNVTRSTIKKNTYRIDNGEYTDKTDGVYNVSDEIYSNSANVSFKAYTRVLNDDEVYWLGEMITSKQLFIELSDRSLVPTMVTNANYSYQRQKYKQGEFNTMQFEFTLAENIIPALSNGTVSFIQGKTFGNDERSGVFRKNNCSVGFTGSYVTLTIPAGTFTSYLSVEDANAITEQYIEDNGQEYANDNGSCIEGVGNEEQSDTFTKNDCTGGDEGTEVTYTVPADTYFAEDVTAANALALADIEANGQNYANIHGSCTPPSEFSSSFTNYSSTSVTYTIVMNGLHIASGTLGAGDTDEFDVPEGMGNDLRVYTTTHSIGSITVRSDGVTIPMTISNSSPGTNNLARNSSIYAINGGVKITLERLVTTIFYGSGTWEVELNYPFTSELAYNDVMAVGYTGSMCHTGFSSESDEMPTVTLAPGDTSGSAVTGGLTGASDKYKLKIAGTLIDYGGFRHNVPFIFEDTPMVVIILNTSCSTYV